ncbi:translation initiation factor IF-2 [bacterium]|nr:translation initiation factor IF-2 [bacterium]
MNITELARRLKITPKELREKLPELGFSIGEKAIQIPDEQAFKVIEKFKIIEKQKQRQKILKEKLKKVRKIEDSDSKEKKVIFIPSRIQVFDLANRLGLKLNVLFESLLRNGVTASLNEFLDFEIAAIIAEEFGFEAKKEQVQESQEKVHLRNKIQEVISKEKKENLVPRPPVVVIMGHVDHGKTTLLSAIYDMDLTSKEHGAITQHIGAYQIQRKGKLITFIDTPGHAAFLNMRVQGGQVADIAILVIAADEGIKPQTLEALKIIQEEKIPFIVAINKIDLPAANVKKVKDQLLEINVIPEDLGGKVICTEISAKTKKGVPELLDLILLLAEMEKQRLLANPSGKTIGTIIESHLDPGFGAAATVIIFNGTLKKGDNFVLNSTYGTARVLKNWQGQVIPSAGPSTPVQVFNFKSLPLAGDILEVVKDQKEFKLKVKEIEERIKESLEVEEAKKEKALSIIVRADTFGTLQAVVTALKSLENEEIKIQVIKKAVGKITEADIILAQTTDSFLIGFNVSMDSSLATLARERGVKVKFYNVIYELIEDIEKHIKDILSGQIVEKEVGEIKIKACFSAKRDQRIVGGEVVLGQVNKGSIVRIFRDDEPLAEGEVLELEMDKNPVEKVTEGNLCGIKVKTSFEIQPGDVLKVYKQVPLSELNF